jgi:hypothetical protein
MTFESESSPIASGHQQQTNLIVAQANLCGRQYKEATATVPAPFSLHLVRGAFILARPRNAPKRICKASLHPSHPVVQ